MAARPPAGAALDQFLTWRLHRINKLTDRASSEAYAQAFGLPVGQARCLAAIGDGAPLSVVALAAMANLDKGQASRSAQALVDAGLVAKAGSEADGRGVLLSLTPGGSRLWKKVMGLITSRNAEIFGCLDAAEQQLLGSMLDRLIANAGLQDPAAGPKARSRLK